MLKKKKESTVKLVTLSGGSVELGVAHAERLLAMGSKLNGGWVLPADSAYTFDEENGLRAK